MRSSFNLSSGSSSQNENESPNKQENQPENEKKSLTFSDLDITDKMLGEGGDAKVFKAISKRTSKSYAIKMYNLDPKSTRFFMNECRILSLLSNEGIIRYHGFHYGLSANYVMLDYLYGGDLQYSLQQSQENKTKFDPLLKKKISYDVASALQYLHEKEIIHKDIKLENILLDLNGNAKICDFAYSQMSNEKSIEMSGTSWYLSPELLIAHYKNKKSFAENPVPYSAMSDIYALSITLYVLFYELNPYYEEIKMPELYKKAKMGERPNIPENRNVKIAQFIKFCWMNDPSMRRTAKDAVEFFQEEIKIHSNAI